MITYTEEIVMVRETCCSCGIVFGMEKNYRDELKDTGNSFYCPNGHGQHYTESTEKKLEEAKKALKSARESEEWWKGRAESHAKEAESVKRMLRSTRGQLTKTKKRIANGVCPCCNRQFVNLHRHMSSQHPEYTDKDQPEPPQDRGSGA